MAPPTRAELRKFGLTVGAAFLVLGTLSWWRGHELPPRVLWGMGAALVVPALVAPDLLGPVQRGWMAAAMFLGHVNTRIILSLLFYTVITPIGFVVRLFRDPLDRSLDRPGDSRWIPRTVEPVDPARYERQF